MSSRPDAVSTPLTTKQLQEFAGVQIGPERELLLEELLEEDELLLEEDEFDEVLLDEDELLLEETPDELDDELDERLLLDEDEDPDVLDDELLLDDDENPDVLDDDELLLEEDDELNDELLLDDEELLNDELDDIAAFLPNHSLNSSGDIHTQHRDEFYQPSVPINKVLCPRWP